MLNEGVPPQATLEYSYGYYNDLEIRWEWKEPESDETYAYRIRQYESRLAKWYEWAEKNADLIAKEEAHRAKQEETKKTQLREERRLKDEREYERLKKKLGKNS